MIVQRTFYFLILSYVFFFLGNGALGLTHPDEVFYAQTAQEMIEKHSLLVPYLFDAPNFEKPIFSYWLFILSFKLFGVSSFSARFFPAVFGLLGVLGIFFLGKMAFRKEEKGSFAALILMSSALYLGLSRTVFTDMFFTVLIEFSFISFYWAYINPQRKRWGILLFWFFSGLAVLTKGIPGVIPIIAALIFLFIRKDIRFICNRYAAAGLVVFCLVALPWYVYMIKTFGQSFIQEFYYNDHLRRITEAEHSGNDTWYFYPLTMVGLMAPWSIFVILAVIPFYKKLRSNESPIYLFLALWIGVVFCTFQLAHSKLVSYVFPLFPAMALVVGDFVSNIMDDSKYRKWFIISSFLLPAIVLIAAILGLTIFSKYFPSGTIFSLFLVGSFVLIFTCFISLNMQANKRIVGLIMAQIPVLLALGLWNRVAFEDYASSKNPGKYLLDHYQISEPIVCSKHFLRSTRFFTDKKVIMLNLNGSKFFSPHAVEELKSEQEVREFINSRPITLAVLKKREVVEVQNIVKNLATVEIEKIFGDQYVVEIERNDVDGSADR